MSSIIIGANLSCRSLAVLDERCAGNSSDTSNIVEVAPGLLRYETNLNRWIYYKDSTAGWVTLSSNIISLQAGLGISISSSNRISIDQVASLNLTNLSSTTRDATDNSTNVATTAFVQTAISNLIDTAPSTLDTLNELAAALNDDANFSTTITNQIALKLPISTFTTHPAFNITTNDITNWNTAYSWGDHSIQGYLTSTDIGNVLLDGDFTTAGIMATDGSGVYSIITDNSTNWNTAHGWGDHSVEGYLTSTDIENVLLDGDFATAGIMATDGSGVYSIITDNSTNWTAAYGWGDHSVEGYLTSTDIGNVLLDGDFTTAGIMATDGSGVYSIITDNSTNWNTAHGWGDHSIQGYLTKPDIENVLLDGDFATVGIMTKNTSGVYSTITDNSTNWNTAYGWGDHSIQGYLTAQFFSLYLASALLLLGWVADPWPAEDTDAYTVSGRSYSGYCGHSDYAAFGHIDVRTVNGYALLQGAAGDTYVNANGSGRSIHFRNNNSDIAKIFSERKFEIYGYLQVRGDYYQTNSTYLHCSFASPSGYDWWNIRTSNKNYGDGIEDHGNENRGDLFIVTSATRSSGEYYEGVFIRNVDSTSRLNFTGQHRVIMNINLQEEIGLIVSSSGKYINIDASTKTNVNEALPTCVLSNVKKDKRVFGIISNKEDTSMSRTYDQGNIQQLGTKKFNNERRFIINSLGEGSVWVTNTNGNLQNGDYITTSVIPGYGELQDEDVLKNYTVAKITCDCNFNTELKPSKTVRRSIKKWIQEKKIWQNVTQEEEKTRNVFNQDLGRWIQEKYTETKEIQEQVFDEYDVYDEEGNVIDKHKLEKIEYIEKEEYEIIYDENGDVILDDDLDSDGNIVFDYEYPTRFLNENGQQITHEVYTEMLNNGQPVYIACFVGCTYHCG